MSLLGGLGERLADSVKTVVINIIDFLTPIITVISVGMIFIGLLLYALKQEFYGVRLIISGAIALAILHLIIPIILGYL